MEQTPQIEPCDGALRRCGALAQQVAASDQIVETLVTQLRDAAADVLGQQPEVVDQPVGGPGEAFAQLRVLRRHAHRTGVGMALAQHPAPQRHERRRAESVLLSPQQGADQHVAGAAARRLAGAPGREAG